MINHLRIPERSDILQLCFLISSHLETLLRNIRFAQISGREAVGYLGNSGLTLVERSSKEFIEFHIT